jgi:hypothetical protein
LISTQRPIMLWKYRGFFADGFPAGLFAPLLPKAFVQ